jgi:hypothetical protein
LEGIVALPPLAVDVVSIVMRGHFRPVTISPRDLRDQELIGETEYAEASFEVRIPNEVAVFEAGWIRCRADPESLELSTGQEAEQERLRDVAVALLRVDDDRRLSMMGINRAVHFSVPDRQRWNAIGDNLVHNDIWGDVLSGPGMRSVIYWAQRTDQYGGRIQVQVEPSFVYAPGIFFSYNDHYDLTKVDHQPLTRDEAQQLSTTDDTEATKEKTLVAAEVLNQGWESFEQRVARTLERVWQQAGRQ